MTWASPSQQLIGSADNNGPTVASRGRLVHRGAAGIRDVRASLRIKSRRSNTDASFGYAASRPNDVRLQRQRTEVSTPGTWLNTLITARYSGANPPPPF